MPIPFNARKLEELDIDVVHVSPKKRKLLGFIVGAAAVFGAAFVLFLVLAAFLDKTIEPGQELGFMGIGALLIWADIFLFGLSIRMFRGREDRDGFASPRTLRVASLLLLLLACLGLVRSVAHFEPAGLIPILIYGVVSRYLWLVAKQRENILHNQSTDPTLASGTPLAGPESRHP